MKLTLQQAARVALHGVNGVPCHCTAMQFHMAKLARRIVALRNARR